MIRDRGVRVLAMAALLVAGIALPTSGIAQYFAATSLPNFPGRDDTRGHGINNAGVVVGAAQSGGGSRAFLHASGVFTDLGTLPGGDASWGTALNDSGQATGWASRSDGSTRAFVYSGGTLVELGTLPGGSNSWGNAINSAGHVTGYAHTAGNAALHAFLYTGGALVDLGTLPGGSGSEGYGINAAGQVAGRSYWLGPTITSRAFLYGAGVMRDLGTFPGGGNSWARAVNNQGQVTGAATTAGSAIHAFIYANGTMRDLGTLPGSGYSEGYAINALGDVVGVVHAGVEIHAALWTNDRWYDLNTRVVSGLAGATLTEARGVNDAGRIVAFGCGATVAPSCRTFVLDPVPDPAATTPVPALSDGALILLTLLLAVLAWRRGPSIRR